jgi:hypothetical protein
MAWLLQKLLTGLSGRPARRSPKAIPRKSCLPRKPAVEVLEERRLLTDWVNWLYGEGSDDSLSPRFPLTSDMPSFVLQTPTYANSCYATREGDPRIRRDEQTRTIGVWLEGGHGDPCPDVWDPVSGLGGRLDPLAPGRWTISGPFSSFTFVVSTPGSEGLNGVWVNDGSAQRSMVGSLTFAFSSAMTVGPDAFAIHRQDGSPVAAEVGSTVWEGVTWAWLVFTGDDVVGGSLADGNYTLTVRGDSIQDVLGRTLDGDGDGKPGGDYTEAFFRLFGDGDGDRDVDEDDAALFAGTFGRTAEDPDFLWYFDHDGDGDVDDDDRAAFDGRFGTMLPP